MADRSQDSVVDRAARLMYFYVPAQSITQLTVANRDN